MGAAGKPRLPSHHLLLWDNVEPFPGQPINVSSPNCLGFTPGLPTGSTCLAGTPYPGGDGISPLLLMWRSGGPSLNASRMTELLTRSLRQCPSTFRRKLISTPCIRDIILILLTRDQTENNRFLAFPNNRGPSGCR